MSFSGCCKTTLRSVYATIYQPHLADWCPLLPNKENIKMWLHLLPRDSSSFDMRLVKDSL